MKRQLVWLLVLVNMEEVLSDKHQQQIKVAGGWKQEVSVEKDERYTCKFTVYADRRDERVQQLYIKPNMVEQERERDIQYL